MNFLYPISTLDLTDIATFLINVVPIMELPSIRIIFTYSLPSSSLCLSSFPGHTARSRAGNEASLKNNGYTSCIIYYRVDIYFVCRFCYDTCCYLLDRLHCIKWYPALFPRPRWPLLLRRFTLRKRSLRVSLPARRIHVYFIHSRTQVNVQGVLIIFLNH